MGKRVGWIVAVVVLGLTFGVAYWADQRSASNAPTCEEKLAQDEGRVHNERNWTGQDITGIGEYQETHWKVDALSNPCSAAPGPNDWRYQGLIQLRPENVAKVAAGYQNWKPATPTIPADLQEFVPAGVVWESAEAQSGAIARYQGTIYLDLSKALVYFDLSTH